MNALRFGQHAHYLGRWEPATALRVREGAGPWRATTDEQREGLVATPASVQLCTGPAWLRNELEALEWAGEGEGDERERAHFAKYTERVVEWLRFLGLPLGAQCQVQLGATTERALPSDSVNTLVKPALEVLLNVGDARLTAVPGAGEAGVVLEPGEGCVLAPEAPSCSVFLGDGGELGLYLRVRG